jgi:hypothetical protein
MQYLKNALSFTVILACTMLMMWLMIRAWDIESGECSNYGLVDSLNHGSIERCIAR